MIKLLLKIFSLLGFEITIIKPIKRNMAFEDNTFNLDDIIFHKDLGFGRITCVYKTDYTFPIQVEFNNKIKYFIYTKYGSFSPNFKDNVIYNTKQYKIYTNKIFKIYYDKF